MKKTTIDPAKYKRLLKLAKGGGNKDMVGTVLGSTDPDLVEAYLTHLKDTDPDAVPAGWGGEEEEDDLDEFGLDDDEDDEDEEEAAPEPPKKQKGKKAKAAPDDDLQASVDEVTEAVTAVQAAGGKSLIPEIFRLRTPEGETLDLECFSKGRFGYILRVPVPTDMRTVNVKGQDLTVDYLALQRDPDGTTEGVLNSKLIVLCDLGL